MLRTYRAAWRWCQTRLWLWRRSFAVSPSRIQRDPTNENGYRVPDKVYASYLIETGLLNVHSAQRDVVQNLQADLNRLDQALREKQNQWKTCDQSINKHRQLTNRYRIEMQEADTVVENLQDALDSDAIEEGRLEALKEQLAEAQEEVQTYEASYGDSVVTKDKNNESLKAAREQMAMLDKNIEEAELKVRKAESRATRCANERHAALRDKNTAIEAVAKENKEKSELEGKRVRQIATVEEFREEAQKHSARVSIPEGETMDTLERKFEKLKKDLEAANKRLVLYVP